MSNNEQGMSNVQVEKERAVFEIEIRGTLVEFGTQNTELGMGGVEKVMLDGRGKIEFVELLGFIGLKTASGRWKDDSGWQILDGG